MQAKNGSVIATVIICAVLLGGFVFLMIPEVPEVPEAPVVPTAAQVAAEVAGLIVIPSAPVVDTGMVDRICELTDGCEFWDINDDDAPGDLGQLNVLNELQSSNARKDFEEAFGDLIGLDFDDDEFDFKGPRSSFYEDHQIRASDADAEDDNWKAEVFMRVTWRDTDKHYDGSESEVMYVLVTSVLDEGDYDSLSIEEVTRRFEFD